MLLTGQRNLQNAEYARVASVDCCEGELWRGELLYNKTHSSLAQSCLKSQVMFVIISSKSTRSFLKPLPCVDEVKKLQKYFSIYRQTSEFVLDYFKYEFKKFANLVC